MRVEPCVREQSNFNSKFKYNKISSIWNFIYCSQIFQLQLFNLRKQIIDEWKISLIRSATWQSLFNGRCIAKVGWTFQLEIFSKAMIHSSGDFFFREMTSQALSESFAHMFAFTSLREEKKLVSSMNHWIEIAKRQTQLYLSLLSLTQKVFRGRQTNRQSITVKLWLNFSLIAFILRLEVQSFNDKAYKTDERRRYSL